MQCVVHHGHYSGLDQEFPNLEEWSRSGYCLDGDVNTLMSARGDFLRHRH